MPEDKVLTHHHNVDNMLHNNKEATNRRTEHHQFAVAWLFNRLAAMTRIKVHIVYSSYQERLSGVPTPSTETRLPVFRKVVRI